MANDDPPTPNEQQDSAHHCQAVAVKLPPFWPDNIDVWFAQVESQFRIKGVSSQQTKFDYVVQAMSQSDMVKVIDLIKDPPSVDPFSALKLRLTSMYTLTEYARYEAFVSLPMSGDMLPSALMAKMLSYLPADHKPCWFVRCAFLHRLPAEIRCHLVDDVTEDPLKLALRADRIYRSRVTPSPAVNAVSSHPDEQTINAVRQPTKPPTNRRSVSRSPGFRRSQTPHSGSTWSQRSESPDSTCWYHRKHGDKAEKCKAPCSWSGN